MRLIVITLILLVFFVSVAHAFNPIGDAGNATAKAGADMVKNGIDAWFTASADDMINYGDNVTDTDSSSRSPLEMTLFEMVSQDYNPFANPAVMNTISMTSLISLVIFVIFLMAGLVYVVIHQYSPHIGEAIDFAMNMKQGFNYKEYFKSIGGYILFLIFGYLGVAVFILFAHAISQMLTISALDATVSSPENGIIYFFMAAAYLGLALFMGMRILIISIITACLMVIFAAWTFNIMRETIISLLIYFAGLIMLQPILIAEAAIGIITIKWLTASDFLGYEKTTMFPALIIIMILTAIVFVLSPILFRKVLSMGTKMLIVAMA
jgi:hypothetical protein